MHKFIPFIFLVFVLLNLSCNDKNDFSNPLDSQATVTLQPPTNLQVDSIAETVVVLSFEDANISSNYPNVKMDYEIEQSTDASNWTKVNNVSLSGTRATVTGTFSSTLTYSYRIRAKAANTTSSYSNIATANFAFPAPSNLQITSLTTTQVSLSWTANSSFETSFDVEQSSIGTTFGAVKTVGANITSTSIAGTFDSITTYYFRVQAKTIINKSGYSNVISRKISSPISIEMVFVQGGTFQMGSTTGYSDELPVHSVTVESFSIDKYEVTYGEWKAVYIWGLTHGYTDLPAGQNGYSPNGINNPVTMVTWYDILKWCNARSEKDGMTPVYYTSNTLATVYRTGQIDLAVDAVKWTANGYRLPTEAEWEFAARGGNNSNGYTYCGSNTIDDVAWYYPASGNTTHTVGTKSANELGIYDMSGNVWEWCWDWYGTYSSSAQTDPKGATSGTYRVLHGGSFYVIDSFSRVAGRYGVRNPGVRGAGVGFRCTQD